MFDEISRRNSDVFCFSISNDSVCGDGALDCNDCAILIVNVIAICAFFCCYVSIFCASNASTTTISICE